MKKPNRFAPIPLPDLRGEDHAEFRAGFWAHVDQSGGPDACWVWTGRRRDGTHDYGICEFGGRRNCQAHRLAYALTVGEVPRRAMVLHSCDNPPCQNPRHLHLGDHKMNGMEMSIRGRSPLMRYTAAVVDDMRRRRAAGETYPEIADRYGASSTAVSKLVSGQGYSSRPRHLPPTVRPPVPVRRSLADRINIEIADILVKAGWTIRATAEWADVSEHSLWFALRRAKSFRLGRRSSIRPTPALAAHVAALVAAFPPTPASDEPRGLIPVGNYKAIEGFLS